MKMRSLVKEIAEHEEVHRLLIKAPYILAAIVVGLVSVGFGYTVDYVTTLSKEWLNREPLAFLLLTPTCFILARWIVQRLGPAAAGSGIPQVMASLELPINARAGVDYLLNIKVLFAKILSCLTCLLGGGLVGREGPMVQISATIFLSIGRRMRWLFPKVDDHSLIVAGGAAGVAAAFNTPLGGIVFAIEELINQHFSKVRSVLIIGVIIAGMVAQSLVGPYLFFGSVQLKAPNLAFLEPMLCISISLGILGGLFSKLLIKSQIWLGNWSSSRRLLWALVCGLVVAVSLNIMKGHATYAVGGGTNLIKDILWQSQDIHPGLLLHRYIGTLISFVSGCAGGIFAPSLAFGAAFGKVACLMFSQFDPAALTLVGMASFLAAVTRAPFTSMVLVTEMTDGHGIALFVLLASLIAVGISRLIDSTSYYHFQANNYVAMASSV